MYGRTADRSAEPGWKSVCEMRNIKLSVCEELTFAKPPKDTTLTYRAPRSSSFPPTTGTFLNGDLWRKTVE